MEFLDKSIVNFFQRYFPNRTIDPFVRLVDLGLESLDYIGMAATLYQSTQKSIDLTKIKIDTRIGDLAEYLVTQKIPEQSSQTNVKLDTLNHNVYAHQLNDANHPQKGYIIYFFSLKPTVDISKLRIAIQQTIENNYMLNCKLQKMINHYYFVKHTRPPNLNFGGFLFSNNAINKHKLKVQSERLVNLCIQKKWKQYYLVCSFHHIAMDGWSQRIIQEEIFRRYAGLYPFAQKSEREEIIALNSVHKCSMEQESDPKTLKALFNSITPGLYNNLQLLRHFNKHLTTSHHCFVISVNDMEGYRKRNNLNSFSSSVVITFMYYQMLSQALEEKKLFIHITLSNRYLPIPNVPQLAANIPTALPIFLDNANFNDHYFATHIDETLKIFFKSMSYGSITRVLLDNDTCLNKYLSPQYQPLYFMLSYINNTSKIIYGNDSIAGNYIDWQKTRVHLPANTQRIFLHIENMGSEFVLHLHSTAKKEIQEKMHQFLKINFPNIVSDAA